MTNIKSVFMRKKWVVSISLMIPFAMFIILIINSCRHETILVDVPAGMDKTIYFDKNTADTVTTKTVLSIFTKNCQTTTGCHGSGDLFALNSYKSIKKEVSAGNPYSSNAYTAIISVYGNTMPPKRPLSEQDRIYIRLWIEQGANNNKAPFKIDTTIKPPDTAKISLGYACFSRDIKPIIVSNCSMQGCHPQDTSYSTISNWVSDGNLYSVITTKNLEDRMPLGKPRLPQANIDSISSWLNQGATNGNCVIACDTSKHTYADIWNIINPNCTGCHMTPTSANHNIQLTDYSTISPIAKKGQLVTVITTTGVTHMPQGSTLSSCDIDIIKKWVNAGSKQ